MRQSAWCKLDGQAGRSETGLSKGAIVGVPLGTVSTRRHFEKPAPVVGRRQRTVRLVLPDSRLKHTYALGRLRLAIAINGSVARQVVLREPSRSGAGC